MDTEMITTKTVVDLAEKTSPVDTDLFMAGDAGSAALKKFKWSNLLAAIKTKIAAWTFETLNTSDKTIVGAVNELNNNMANMNRYDAYKATSVGDSDFPLQSCLEISFSNATSKLNANYKISQTASGAHLAGLPSALSEVTCVVYRTVFFSGSTVHTCVKLEELHPNPGRIWYNYYNSGTWAGWKNISPS